MNSQFRALAIAALLMAGLSFQMSFVPYYIAEASSNSGPGSSNSGSGSRNSGPGSSDGDGNSTLPAPATTPTGPATSNASATVSTISIPQSAASRDVAISFFEPSPATVSSGATVTWVNDDNSPHTATADDGSFNTGIINGGSSGSAIVSGSGAVPYHCDVHPFMTGTLQVIPASASGSTAGNPSALAANGTDKAAGRLQALEQAELALQQAILALQQALLVLQQASIALEGTENRTATSINGTADLPLNNTGVTR